MMRALHKFWSKDPVLNKVLNDDYLLASQDNPSDKGFGQLRRVILDMHQGKMILLPSLLVDHRSSMAHVVEFYRLFRLIYKVLRTSKLSVFKSD